MGVEERLAEIEILEPRRIGSAEGATRPHQQHSREQSQSDVRCVTH